MEREFDRKSDLIELGTASADTKGYQGRVPDLAFGITGTVLTDD